MDDPLRSRQHHLTTLLADDPVLPTPGQLRDRGRRRRTRRRVATGFALSGALAATLFVGVMAGNGRHSTLVRTADQAGSTTTVAATTVPATTVPVTATLSSPGSTSATSTTLSSPGSTSATTAPSTTAIATPTTTTTAMSPSTSTTMASPCAADSLKVLYKGMYPYVIGETPGVFEVQNVGASPCTLGGYPTLQFYDASGRPLFTSVTHEDGFGSPLLAAPPPNERITVPPGQGGWFAFMPMSADTNGGQGVTFAVQVSATVSIPGITEPFVVTAVRSYGAFRSVTIGPAVVTSIATLKELVPSGVLPPSTT
jgi:hypothetical protein